MAKRRVPNLLALAVLACVSERPMHPYEISTTLRTRGKEESIKLNFGSLYSVVESLAKHGLIESQGTVRDGKRPERTIYAITADGRAEMEDWLAELLSTPKKEYTSLEAALSLAAGLAPDEVSRLLTARATRLRMDIGSVDAGLAYTTEMGLPELFVIEEQYRKALMEAELAFVTSLVDPHRQERARRHPLVAPRSTSCRSRASASRRSPATRSSTSERRPPRSHRSSTRTPLRTEMSRDPRAGAATPDPRAQPRAARPDGQDNPRAVVTIRQRGRLHVRPRSTRMTRSITASGRYAVEAADLRKSYPTGRGKPPVQALDGLSFASSPAPSTGCSAPTAPASPPPSRCCRRCRVPTPARPRSPVRTSAPTPTPYDAGSGWSRSGPRRTRWRPGGRTSCSPAGSRA